MWDQIVDSEVGLGNGFRGGTRELIQRWDQGKDSEVGLGRGLKGGTRNSGMMRMKGSKRMISFLFPSSRYMYEAHFYYM